MFLPEAIDDRAQFSYSFSVWPDETWDFQKEVYELFQMLNARVEMVFTRNDFERFRSCLSHDGFTVREVERVPYCEPEQVP